MKDFRTYSDVKQKIKENYKKARTNQTVKFVTNMQKKHLGFKNKMKINDIFKHLSKFVDVSDPDISLPNFYHGVQTAEAIRKDGLPEWFQLIGLIHDIGKIMFLWGNDNDGTTIKNQWSIVGDTFIVGCEIPKNIVFPEFNKLNPDMSNSLYNTKLGMYEKNCGLDNVLCSWGHDEYLYQILLKNKCNFPPEALYIVRFHSLYSYHTYDEYKHFMNKKDHKMIGWLKLFNKYDLYTKTDDFKLTDDMTMYYNNLIAKYIPKSELIL